MLDLALARGRGVARTSTYWVDVCASTLGRARSLAQRVHLNSWDQGQRTNDEATATSIDEEGLFIAHSRRARVWAAGTGSETHVPRGFPSMNPGLERWSEFCIEEQDGPHSVLILDVLDDVQKLSPNLPAHLSRDLLSEHLVDAALIDLIDESVPLLLHRLQQITTRTGHRLQLEDPSRKVNMQSLYQLVPEVHPAGTAWIDDACEIAFRFSYGSRRSSLESCVGFIRFSVLELLSTEDLLLEERFEQGT